MSIPGEHPVSAASASASAAVATHSQSETFGHTSHCSSGDSSTLAAIKQKIYFSFDVLCINNIFLLLLLLRFDDTDTLFCHDELILISFSSILSQFFYKKKVCVCFPYRYIASAERTQRKKKKKKL